MKPILKQQYFVGRIESDKYGPDEDVYKIDVCGRCGRLWIHPSCNENEFCVLCKAVKYVN